MNNKMEKNAPSTLSDKNALFISDCDTSDSTVIAERLMNNLVTERKTEAMKLKDKNLNLVVIIWSVI